MPGYDGARFDPPAPMATVTLRNPDNHAVVSDVPMLLDSGADVTLIPQASADLAGAEVVPGKQYELIGFNGSLSLVAVVRLEVHFCGRTFRGQFLLSDQEWGILGRNVLNAVPILLDGPNLTWDEHRTE
jgi:hypothetical protein